MQLFFLGYPNQAASSTALHVYLSQANGSDANDGLSAAHPVATLARVWQLLPPRLTQPFIIHADGGDATTLTTTYDWTSVPEIEYVGEDAYIVLWGDGAGQSTHDGCYVVGTYQADVGSTSVDILRKGAAIATGTLRSMTLEYTSGACAGQRRTIGWNEGKHIYPLASTCSADGTTLTPADGDAFRIFRPNVVFDGTIEGLVGNNTRLHFVNIALATTNFTNFLSTNSEHMMYGVELRGAVRVGGQNVQYYLGCAGYSTTAFDYPLRPLRANVLWDKICAALGAPVAVGSGKWDGWGMGEILDASFQIPFAPYDVVQSLQPIEIYGFLSGGYLLLNGVNSLAMLYGFHLRNVIAEYGARIQLDSIPLDGVASYMGVYNDSGIAVELFGSYSGAIIETAFFNSGTIYAKQLSAANILFCNNQSIQVHWFALVVNGINANAAGCINVSDNGIIKFGYGAHSLTTTAGSGLTIETGGQVIVQSNATLAVLSLNNNTVRREGVLGVYGATSLQVTAANAVGLIIQGGKVTQEANLDITCSNSNAASGVLTIAGSGACFDNRSGVLTVANSSVGVNANGIYMQLGAELNALSSISVTTTGGNPSYGVVMKGNCRATFTGQPTGIVGDNPARDLLVDATAIADGALTPLVATTGGGGSVAVAIA